MTVSTAWIAWLAVSPVVGSFIGVVVTRFRSPGAIVFGRSACPQCGARLAPLDLVPLLSWCLNRGRCRHCGGEIGIFYPAVELAAIIVAGWSMLAAPDLDLWASCCLGWTLLALALIDAREFVLPDFLTLPLVLLGLLASWIIAGTGLLDHILGAACGLTSIVVLRWLYYLVRRREGIGLGDAKLLAAAGAWVSWTGLASVVLIGALTGLSAMLARRWRTGEPLSYADRVPFGAFLCLGTWLVWLYGPIEVQFFPSGPP
ncbi:MAG: type 4 prepilin peptidase 1 [Rhodospirillales bacterium]|nr:type 4 prepilin peptidase 1 [Rhodospirillales bacterium]